MTSILKMLAVVMVVGVLFTGALALAVDYAWDCTGFCTGAWTTGSSWTASDNGYPDDANDNASITSSTNIITYNSGSALTINNLTLAGASPTKRKLHIKDADLTVANLDLDDYAELDLDEDLTVNGDTLLSGSIWIDQTEADMNVTAVFIDGKTALHLTQDATSCFCATTLTIDAEAADAPRKFELDGGTITLGSMSPLTIKSDTDAPNRRATLWLRNGEIAFGTTSQFLIVGGDTSAKRVELDLDQDVDVQRPSGLTTMYGYVDVDVASGKHFNTAKLVIIGPAVLKVEAGSGAGLFAFTGETL